MPFNGSITMLQLAGNQYRTGIDDMNIKNWVVKISKSGGKPADGYFVLRW